MKTIDKLMLFSMAVAKLDKVSDFYTRELGLTVTAVIYSLLIRSVT